MDSAIQRINHYPLDKYYQNLAIYPVDSDLSNGWCYPLFKQLGSGVCFSTVPLTHALTYWIFAVIKIFAFFAFMHTIGGHELNELMQLLLERQEEFEKDQGSDSRIVK